MIRFLKCLTTAGVFAMAIHSSVAMGQSLTDAVTVPPVPMDIKVPDGHVAFLKGQAVGTQNYICLPTVAPAPPGVAWKLFGPQATLFLKFKLFNVEVVQQIMTHYLSANPDEVATNRATWQSSVDTSAVWAKATGTAPVPDTIPWLRLEVVGAERGPTGGGMLIQAKYIHRLNTTGGVMPATGCSTAEDLGRAALVPYTADYFFYKAAN